LALLSAFNACQQVAALPGEPGIRRDSLQFLTLRRANSSSAAQHFSDDRVSICMKARLILYATASAVLFTCQAPVRVFSSVLCALRQLLSPTAIKSFFFDS
jgi:hypothetical protein